MKTYQQIIDTLNTIPMIPTYIPSLDRIQTAIKESFAFLSEHQDRMILIAGTNGKGSTAKSLESLLLTSGKQVCLFTSPHLVKINERFRLNGKMSSDQDICLHYSLVESVCKKHTLTHFEILTMIAISFFADSIKKGAYCIWEVGMGGRWDATNAIPHRYNVLTTIGIDHQKYLGTSIEEIAQNKFDIIHTDSITCSGFLPSSTFLLLKNKIATEKSTWFDLATDTTFQLQYGYDREDGLKDYLVHNGKRYALGLSGERGYKNTLLALYVLKTLGIEINTKHLESLSQIRWPHRFSLLKTAQSPCPVYLSGDHNPEGIGSLLPIIERIDYKKLWLIVALTEGRDVNDMLEPLGKITNSKMTLTTSPFKGQQLSDYKRWSSFDQIKPQFIQNCEDAFLQVCSQASNTDVILVTGSLYLTGKIDEKFGIHEDSI